MSLFTILIAVTIYILEYSLDFNCHKAGKLRYTSVNPHMNSLAVDMLAMVTEPQLNSYCAILTLHGAIKIDASILAQYIAPYTSIITAQTLYCTINIACIAAP
jgi:hypothetical protein